MRKNPMSVAERINPFPVQPRYSGIYSHGVVVAGQNRAAYVSGQIGIAPTGRLADGFHAQCRQAIFNVEAVLRESNMHIGDLVKMTFYLTRREDMDALVEVRKDLLDGIAPAITTVIVAGLVSPDWLVEVEAYACSSGSGSSFIKRLGSI
jgi:enamine deaminase RidA (YjgF/YER057c/UK114 family)